jgi:peptidoglycan/xylan/chitin deacetylase (PgdA/CDA1 family)
VAGVMVDVAAGAAALGLLAGGALYASVWPTSRIFGRALIAGNDPDEVALTFDDGPNDAATPALLEVLARHEVRATFFTIGGFARQRPELLREVVAAGHLVGNHTMTHPKLSIEPGARVRQELADCSAVLEDITGKPVRFFRPPFGARRPMVLRTARETGIRLGRTGFGARWMRGLRGIAGGVGGRICCCMMAATWEWGRPGWTRCGGSIGC